MNLVPPTPSRKRRAPTRREAAHLVGAVVGMALTVAAMSATDESLLDGLATVLFIASVAWFAFVAAPLGWIRGPPGPVMWAGDGRGKAGGRDDDDAEPR